VNLLQEKRQAKAWNNHTSRIDEKHIKKSHNQMTTTMKLFYHDI